MLRAMGEVVRECEASGMPLLAIMYPRSESSAGDNNYDDLKRDDPKQYSQLVAHAARVAADLGADIIKTKYTGDPKRFAWLSTPVGRSYHHRCGRLSRLSQC